MTRNLMQQVCQLPSWQGTSSVQGELSSERQGVHSFDPMSLPLLGVDE